MSVSVFKAVVCSAFMLFAMPLAAASASGGGDNQRLSLTAALAEADYPPFYFREDDKLVGFSIEVLDYISRDVGVDIHYQRLSWPRVLKSLEDGRVDMVTTFSNTAERAPLVVYTGVPHAVERNHLFTVADSNVTFDGSMESLAADRIGAITGYSYGTEFDNANYLVVERVLDEPTLVRMILGRRFDIAVGNPFAIRLEAKKFGAEDQLRFLDPPVNRSPIYMAFSRKLPQALDLAAKFTTAILQFKQTDTYQQLLDKYQLRASGFSE